MKLFLIALFILLGVNLNAQDTLFSKTYDRFDIDLARPIASALTLENGLITISNSQSASEDGGILLRTNPDGTVLWERKYFGPVTGDGLYLNDVISTYDSCFIVSGQVLQNGASGYFPFCMKLNDLGDTIWTKTFDFSTQLDGDYGDFLSSNTHITETGDSSFLMIWQHSSFDDFPGNPDHLCVSKITSDGNVSWSNSILTNSTFFASDLAEHEDQSIYITGNTENTNGSGYIVHLSDSGMFDWANKYDGVVFQEILLDSSDFAASFINTTGNSSGIMKFDLLGVNTHRCAYSSWVLAIEPSLAQRSNGNYIFTQKGDNFGGGVIVEVNDTLALVNLLSIQMILQSVRSIPNYGAYAVGYGPMYGIKSDDNQLGIVRLDSLMESDGWCVWPEFNNVFLESTITDQPEVFVDAEAIIDFNIALDDAATSSVVEYGCVTFLGSIDENEGTWNETISPNPSTGEFTISWGDYRDAEIIVFNSVGKEIHRVSAKNSLVEINLQNEENGVYYYRLTDQEGSQSNGRLVLMN